MSGEEAAAHGSGCTENAGSQQAKGSRFGDGADVSGTGIGVAGTGADGVVVQGDGTVECDRTATGDGGAVVERDALVRDDIACKCGCRAEGCGTTDLPVYIVIQARVDYVDTGRTGRGQCGADLEDHVGVVQTGEVEGEWSGQLG